MFLLKFGVFFGIAFALYVTPINAAEDTGFYLYTRRNPGNGQQQRIYTNDVNGLRSSNYDASKPTRFVIHGFVDSGAGPLQIRIRDAILTQGEYNVFIVDWSSKSYGDYTNAYSSVGGVASAIASFIDFLTKNTATTTKNITIVGFSMGAHIAGLTGQNVKTGKIGTIVGLDPAAPIFEAALVGAGSRLSSDDADYVLVIHTNAGGNVYSNTDGNGFTKAIGHADFYINGGKSQPSCATSGQEKQTCAHTRAPEIYAESLTSKNGFWGKPCTDYNQALNNQCNASGTWVKMAGEPIQTNIRGVYYVTTNSKSPFAQ